MLFLWYFIVRYEVLVIIVVRGCVLFMLFSLLVNSYLLVRLLL